MIKINKQTGFAMPMILTFIILLSVVGIAIVQNVTQTNGSAVLHSQVQIAHIASKAAIDYAEEQFELNSSYSGTPEQDLFVNDFYRATIEVDVLYDQSSTAKRVQGIGRVYIPETSSSAKVVRDIKSTIIRNGEVIITAGQVDPATYNPLLWLDANEPDSLYKTVVSPNTQTINALAGSAYGDVVEERGSNASSSKGSLLFGDSDLEMSYDGNTKGNQTIGLRFRSIQTPKNAVIQNAYIQFQADETKTAGVVQFEVYGVASDDPGSWSGNYAVANATKTSTILDWQPPNWNSVGSNGVNERLDVTSIVQELVNRSGWNPNNAMAFGIKWKTGSGVRTAESGTSSGGPQLFIQWDSASTASPAESDGDNVVAWYDKSGNNNDALSAYGTSPILKINQINGLNAVRFSSNGNLLSSITSNTARELTVFMIMAPNTSSSTDARFISVMSSTQNSDNSSSGIIPLMKSGSTTTLKQYFNGSSGRSLSSTIDGNWSEIMSRTSYSDNEWLITNSTNQSSGNSFSPNFNFDQIYIGGTRSGSTGAYYANADIAEIIIYDKKLTCLETQGVENYLEAKYGLSYSDKSPCN
ncbi:hypothetical protein KC960_00530 [Candidatus Saccharibacteria bacterium]|nr:hypothetical protein [Candidatus Saccharibacteria bacterium]